MGPNREDWSQSYPGNPPQWNPNMVVRGPIPPEGTSKAFNDAVEAQRFINKNTVVNVEITPDNAPPYKGKRLWAYAQAVVGVVVGNDTEADSGVTEVLAALNKFRTGGTGQAAMTALSPTTFGDYLTVASFTVRQGTRLTIKGAGVWCHDAYGSDYGALLWRLAIGQPGGGTTIVVPGNPTELGAFSSVDQLAEAHHVAFAGDLVQLQVSNRDTRSGSVVEARIDGWEFPVAAQDDSLQSLIGNMTIDSNGRWTTGSASTFCPPQNGC